MTILHRFYLMGVHNNILSSILVACVECYSKGRNYRIEKTAVKKLITLLKAVFINSRISYVIIPRVMYALSFSCYYKINMKYSELSE